MSILLLPLEGLHEATWLGTAIGVWAPLMGFQRHPLDRA